MLKTRVHSRDEDSISKFSVLLNQWLQGIEKSNAAFEGLKRREGTSSHGSTYLT